MNRMTKCSLIALYCLTVFASPFLYGKAKPATAKEKRVYQAVEIFPLSKEHTHGSTVVELPNGDLLAAWFQGSGERWADDVRIMGSRLCKGKEQWSPPFLMADVPEFPDINPILFLDHKEQLWLVWYTVIANQWETSLPKYRISTNYMQTEGPPEWKWQDVIYFKPGSPAFDGIQPDDRFVTSLRKQAEDYMEYVANTLEATDEQVKKMRKKNTELLEKANGNNMIRRGRVYFDDGTSEARKLGYAYFRRMGWQTKNKAVLIDNQRIIIPFYSDGFDFSIMAITDDEGQTWQFSNPLVGAGNIQPSIAMKKDGTLVAYMRDNGPPPNRLHVSESMDKGITWGAVRDSILPNPGSGADIVTLSNGHWIIAYNDAEQGRGRHTLAVSISTNEGKTWPYTRHLELDTRDEKIATQASYPSIIQGKDGLLHTVYSFCRGDQKGIARETIKYVQFDEAWVMQGD